MFKYLLILCLVIYLIYLFRYNNTENFLGLVIENFKLIGLKSSGEIHIFDGINPAGVKIPGLLVNVSLKNNNAWGVNADNEIFYGDVSNPSATNWNKLPGLLTQISVDDYTDILAGVNKGGDIFVATTNIKSNPNWTKLPGNFINVDISNNKLYGINKSNEIFYKPDITTNNNWVKLPGSLKQIVYTEQDGNKLVGVNSTNDVYYADADLSSSPNWVGLSKKMKYVTLFMDHVIGVDLEGITWACDSKTKQWMKTNISTIFNQISLYKKGK